MGFLGDGYNCTGADKSHTYIAIYSLCLYGHPSIDIDECETGNNTCSVDASCNNLLGSHECKCLPGFTGDGYNCSGQLVYDHC